MTEEQIEQVESSEVDVQSTQEQPNIDELLAKAEELERLQELIAEQEREANDRGISEKLSQAGVTNFDKLRPFLNPEKLGDDSLDELIAVLTELNPKAKPIGMPTNGGNGGQKTAQETMLADAEAVARRTGSVEDIAAFSGLKQKIKQFGGRR